MHSQSPDWTFEVDPAEIDTFVTEVGRLGQAMDRHVQTFAGLELDSGVFGRLPGVSGKVHDAYSNHVKQGTEAFADGRSVLEAASQRGKETAASYRDVEQRNIAAVGDMSPTRPSTERGTR
ncbi:WXG100 family type VII secretion target [Microlunatus sp. Y2014]|uniref:WXG100 family type VII secretion target n=1 Tax=Microlunatus sp. Y2014 TaxID=3418488 RepID=UPI003DA71067